jgi:hypothetical protein
MKVLFIVGLVVLILGVASLVVAIPRNEREGISAGGVSLSVAVQRRERVHPGLSALMILGGLGAMIAGRGKNS